MALTKQDKQEIKDIIVSTVNGKIDRLDEKLTMHQEKMQPIYDVYSTANNMGKFIKWGSGILLAIASIVAVIKKWF